MPWTFAHPAAVLPLRPLKRLSFGALVIGSIAPDIGYYFNCFDFAAAAHTPLGILTLCLPTGLALIVLVRVLHRPVAELMPDPHRQALLSLPLMPRFNTPLAACRVSISVIVGAVTHVAWDSFTHGTGYLVALVPRLRIPILMLGYRSIPLYELLQHASTALGTGVLVVVYVRWLRTRDPVSAVPSHFTDRWRYRFLGALALGSLVAALPIAYFLSTSKPGGPNVTLFVVRYVIFCTTIFAITLSVVAVWVASQWAPAAGQGAQPGPTKTKELKIEKNLELRKDGPEDELEL
jgi:hypothetical protein